MSNIALSQISKLANVLGIEANPEELKTTLMATAFKGPATEAQVCALMIVAAQYSLNPWTKEIYAFPDQRNGIVPVVGIDGWSRIINSHPQFDGMEFVQDEESCTCIIYRKDRAHPTKVTEWMSECRRATGPWGSHPKRMLRHKATIQCARLAFGFVGIYDQDEAERIVEKDITPTRSQAAMDEGLPEGFAEYEAEHLEKLQANAEFGGINALTEMFSKLPSGALKKHFWTKHSNALKKIAEEFDKQATVIEFEEVKNG
jgi:hypothetical protein